MPRSPAVGARKRSARLFAALGDETRLGLVTRLCAEGPMSIKRLTAGTRVTRQAITRHLRVMEGSGLLRSARQGRERVWELDSQRLGDARAHLETISRQWDGAMGRLKSLVEGGDV